MVDDGSRNIINLLSGSPQTGKQIFLFSTHRRGAGTSEIGIKCTVLINSRAANGHITSPWIFPFGERNNFFPIIKCAGNGTFRIAAQPFWNGKFIQRSYDAATCCHCRVSQEEVVVIFKKIAIDQFVVVDDCKKISGSVCNPTISGVRESLTNLCHHVKVQFGMSVGKLVASLSRMIRRVIVHDNNFVQCRIETLFCNTIQCAEQAICPVVGGNNQGDADG